MYEEPVQGPRLSLNGTSTTVERRAGARRNAGRARIGRCKDLDGCGDKVADKMRCPAVG